MRTEVLGDNQGCCTLECNAVCSGRSLKVSAKHAILFFKAEADFALDKPVQAESKRGRPGVVGKPTEDGPKRALQYEG